MEVFCIEDFKNEFDRLKSKKSYRTIEQDIINHYFGKSIDELNNGDLLNASKIAPFLKKRLRGRGGFRVYFLIVIKNNKLYLTYIPKQVLKEQLI